MRVVFDTNVLMTSSPDCEEFVTRLVNEIAKWDEPVFKIALDDEGKILEEYKKELYKLTAKDPLKRRSNLGKLVEYIRQVSNTNSGKLALINSELESGDKDLLDRKGCGTPIEPSIFGILNEKPEETYAYLAEGLFLEVPRGYCPTVPDEIASRFLQKNRHTRELLKTLIDDGPPPDTWPVVEKILEAIKGCGGEPLEGECHEYKGTEKVKKDGVLIDTGVISQNVFDDLPKTVCSMLNKRGGYIFLGIEEKPSFKVVGITWEKSEDANQTRVVSKIKDVIRGFPAHKVDHHIVKKIPPEVLPPNKMLIVIHVRRKAQKEPFYRATGKEGKTEHKDAIWSRCGSQVCLVPGSR